MAQSSLPRIDIERTSTSREIGTYAALLLIRGRVGG